MAFLTADALAIGQMGLKRRSPLKIAANQDCTKEKQEKRGMFKEAQSLGSCRGRNLAVIITSAVNTEV